LYTWRNENLLWSGADEKPNTKMKTLAVYIDNCCTSPGEGGRGERKSGMFGLKCVSFYLFHLSRSLSSLFGGNQSGIFIGKTEESLLKVIKKFIERSSERARAGQSGMTFN
jgi:hypothetical protein